MHLYIIYTYILFILYEDLVIYFTKLINRRQVKKAENIDNCCAVVL
jgi:hypothetical protein